MKAAAVSAGFGIARRLPVLPAHAVRPLIALAFEGLSEDQKELPAVVLYDPEGSALYQRVCAQPEYYLERAESRLLERYGPAIAHLAGSQVALVEYGAGSAEKTRKLLTALPDPHAYVVLDFHPGQLEHSCDAIRRRFRRLHVAARCQDFRNFVPMPAASARARRRLAYISGSTIGTFRPLEAVELLNSIRETVGPDGALVVGVDLVKDPEITQRAYNDAAGAMAEFNLNALARLNRELDATFELDLFRHSATWDAQDERIVMSLVSRRAQSPCVAGITIALEAGETIRTLFAHNYTPETFAAMARVAGWQVREVWTEPQSLYTLQFLEAME